ncbi:hypothetical protein HII31_06453, partial [Pseudocercospora fuligena]
MTTTAGSAPDMATSAIANPSTIPNLPTVAGTQSAAVRTFSIAELHEHILVMGSFSPFELRALLRVNTSFKDTISQSKALGQIFRFESDNDIPSKNPSESALTSFALSADNPLSRAFKPFRFERYINAQGPSAGVLAILSREYLLQDRGDESKYFFSESNMLSSWRCLPNPFPEYEWLSVCFELG